MVGWPLVLNPGANQYTGPAKKCFIAAAAAGDITTIVNKGRWAGPMSSLLLLDVLLLGLWLMSHLKHITCFIIDVYFTYPIKRLMHKKVVTTYFGTDGIDW